MTCASGAEKPAGLLTVENTVKVGLRPAIYLDGKPLDFVMQCHTVEGWADVFRFGPDKTLVVDGDQFVIDRKHGVVTVGWVD